MLLIDDDSVICGLLYDLLSDSYNCQIATCAEQALLFLERLEYDVILTDIFMPGLDGGELLKRIRLKHAETPVIIISGTTPEDKESLMRMGAFTFLSKPFQLDEILDAVARAIVYRKSIGGVRG